MAEFNARTACILGAGGFIGSHLAERLLGDGWEVLGVDLVSGKIEHLLDHPRLELQIFDIREAGHLRALIERSEAVLHLSSICNPSLYNTETLQTIESNFLQALPVVELCRKTGTRLLHFSTCEVYGRTLAGYAPEDSDFRRDPAGFVLSEESAPMVMGPLHRLRWSYAAAKQLLERVIWAEGRENGLEFTIVRPFNFIGPRMDFIPGVDGEGIPRVMACFAKALLEETPLKLVDGGTARRAFTYIDDAVDAVVLMLLKPEASRGRVFNIGHPGNEVSIAELAERLVAAWEEITGRTWTAGIESVSAKEFYGEGYEDCDRRVPVIDQAREQLGWEPKTPLDDTIRLSLTAYLNHYAPSRATSPE